ncbi:hypothetical protein E1B28_007982 [Marasmius oreades]|uniref:Uncharacterized protein n=1 Tax=Marasmius oreades TaxID=181124 RepID=A0A9P7UU13_9AGAR|nr:uncharacterized protein E1B28_007982 [Marasmius oreades]KAG7094382.1 hypothetical protein E1B28_007982 [Marasmius oreades]
MLTLGEAGWWRGCLGEGGKPNLPPFMIPPNPGKLWATTQRPQSLYLESLLSCLTLRSYVVKAEWPGFFYSPILVKFTFSMDQFCSNLDINNQLDFA